MSRVEKTLGQTVAYYRKAAGLTQERLAERAGVSSETISRLERGAAVPSIARLETIARHLQIEVHELLRVQRRASAREQALERLCRVLRRRSAADIDLLHDLAVRLFARRG